MRLIDADKLLEKLKKTDRYFMVKFDIEEAPTIKIPSCFDCGTNYCRAILEGKECSAMNLWKEANRHD